MISVGCIGLHDDAEQVYIETEYIEPTHIITEIEVIQEEPIEIHSISAIEPEEILEAVYRVTAYCPCKICCGVWATNRPLDENGEPIVVGAWGKELVSGFSCASPMAFGTQVELNGVGIVEVQDRTADWVVEEHGDYIIDLYMTDHEAAKEFGVQYLRGVIK